MGLGCGLDCGLGCGLGDVVLLGRSGSGLERGGLCRGGGGLCTGGCGAGDDLAGGGPCRGGCGPCRGGCGRGGASSFGTVRFFLALSVIDRSALVIHHRPSSMSLSAIGYCSCSGRVVVEL